MNPELGRYASLVDFVEFMIWGDLQILAAAQAVPEEEYHKDRGISAGSLHGLLLHAMAAQFVWLERFHGRAPTFAEATNFPTREALARRWPEVHAALRAFMAAQTAESLERALTFKNMRGEMYTGSLGQLLLHVTDHGTYHRGQENTLIKLCGGIPVDIFYYKWAIQERDNRKAGRAGV